MSTEQHSPELTVRDVLQQISRRVDVLETDVRALDAKVDARFDAQRSQMDTRFNAQSSQTNARFDAQDARFDAFSQEIATRFRHLTTTIITTAGVLVAAAGACVAYLKI